MVTIGKNSKNVAALQAAKKYNKRKKANPKHIQLLSLRGSSTHGKNSIFHSSTLQASLVLLLATGIAVFWNWYEGSSFAARPNDPFVVQYLAKTCQSKLPIHNDYNSASDYDDEADPIHNNNGTTTTSNHYCHPALAVMERTHITKRRIRPGETLLIIPRSRQIWDLDALRDDFVRRELLPARHSLTQNPLDSGAFLAAYLAMLLVEESRVVNHTTTTINDSSRRQRQRQRHLTYLRLLPNITTLAQTHPTLWSLEDEVVPLVGRFSSTYAVVRAYRDMMESEYQALVWQSSLFAEMVPESIYLQMRLAVMSRSFGPGPPTAAELTKKHKHHHDTNSSGEDSTSLAFDSIDDELDFYAEVAGVNLTLGCRAMVPILDLYNHHVRPNVDWKYDTQHRTFVVQANAAGGIPVGRELFDSYGRFTDSHLWARYGFVNGDGSEYTQASLAIFHRILDLELKQQFSFIPLDKTSLDPSLIHIQRRDMTRYLQFDDGYAECVQESNNPRAYAMKRLQLEYLLRIANSPRHWIVRMPPRDNNAVPPTFSHTTNRNSNKTLPLAITSSHSGTAFDFSKVLDTCRVISMTFDDYNGTAKEVLEHALDRSTGVFDPPPPVPRGDVSLDFRSLVCTGRLAIVALGRFPHSAKEEIQLIQDSQVQSKNWTAAHLRLGEIQTLEVLRGMAFSTVKRIKGAVEQASPGGRLPLMREKPCPGEFTTPLLDEHEPNDEHEPSDKGQESS